MSDGYHPSIGQSKIIEGVPMTCHWDGERQIFSFYKSDPRVYPGSWISFHSYHECYNAAMAHEKEIEALSKRKKKR